MTRFFFALFGTIILVLVALSIFYLKDSYKVLPITAHEAWYDFTAPQEIFHVKFPTEPHQSTQTTKTRHYEIYTAEKSNGTTFMVSLIEFSDHKESMETYKKAIINDLLMADPQNQLKSMKVGTYHLFSTIDFVITGTTKTIQGRIFSDGNEIYLLTGIFSNIAYDPSEYNYFINSFEWKAIR